MVHRSSLSVLSFLCVFGQTLTTAQFHTSVYKHVKYIAQGCCESVMEFFFKRLHLDTVFTDYYAFLKLNSLSNKKNRSKYLPYLYLLIHIFAIRIT